MSPDSVDALRRKVKAADYERYCISLFLPEEVRPSAWAVLAFNDELGRIPFITQEPMVAAMRLTWWRERIEALYAGEPPRKHEVLLAMDEAIRKHVLPKDDLMRLIVVRGCMIERQPIESDADFLKLAADSSAPILHLWQVMTGDVAREQAEKAATNYAAVRLLEAIPIYAAHGMVVMPENRLAEYGLSAHDLATGNQKNCIFLVVQSLLEMLSSDADFHACQTSPSMLVKCFYSLALMHVQRLQKLDGDIYSSALRSLPPFLLVRLFLSFLLRKW